MIVREGNYYRWVNACFVYFREGTLNIRLFLHWRVVTCIHYVIVVDEKCKLQSEQGGMVTCPEFVQGGFRVRAGWTRFLSEPINDNMVSHAYESCLIWESHCIIKLEYVIVVYVDGLGVRMLLFDCCCTCRCVNSTSQFIPLICWCEFSPHLFWCCPLWTSCRYSGLEFAIVSGR